MRSVIHDAMSALYELVNTTFKRTQPDCEVLDGPSTDDVGQDVVAIGITAEDSTIDGNVDIAGLYVEMETFELECLVRSWTGDSDLSARRARAFELFEEVATIIQGNPTLGDAVARARISGVRYHPARLPEGAVAAVTFKVRIEAFTS